MEQRIEVGRWRVRCDTQRTREAHARLERSGAAECSCSGCRNFEAHKRKWLGGPIGAVLEALGISPAHEVEVYHTVRLLSGRHLYGGWYHFVGAIESGDDFWRREHDGTVQRRIACFEALSPTLSIGLHTELDLVRPPFEGLPLVQLDFHAELPWVVDLDEPE